MALDGAWNAYIFRDGKSSVSGPGLVQQLIQALASFNDASPSARRTALLDLLLRAGELESALADESPSQHDLIARITGELATCLVSHSRIPVDELSLRAAAITAPVQLTVAIPEGFAYYALHPLDFADLVKNLSLSTSFAAVIGIRSIGTTLSAVVKAALEMQGTHAERTTVRPSGHPYDRHTEFSAAQLQWLRTMHSRHAAFFVVDEGPGMSGSSFLSVGDALLAAGIPRSSITFLGSRDPDPSTLTARDAAQRWTAFRMLSTSSTRHLPKQAESFIAGGIWRALVYPDSEQWPASWLQLERLKFLSAAGDVFLKFEGYGRFGRAVHDRAKLIASAGFGPMPTGTSEGFGLYPRLRGKVLSPTEVTPAVLQRIAGYCSFRAEETQCAVPANHHLEAMLRFNVQQEFGFDMPAQPADLLVVRPVIADGRMSPHKWIDSGGALLKLDGSIHGDDHFFPGPTDIAWDLAGTIVEWALDSAACSTLLDCYSRTSGDHAHQRLLHYCLAYSVFRTAYSKMAAASMQGSEEEARLLQDYYRYRAQAERYLNSLTDYRLSRSTSQKGQSSEVTAA